MKWFEMAAFGEAMLNKNEKTSTANAISHTMMFTKIIFGNMLSDVKNDVILSPKLNLGEP